jgi:long-chain acyl-CoA synthetase
MPRLETLQQLLLRFRERGGAPAIIAAGPDRATQISFADLLEASHRLAEVIMAGSAGRGSTVGLMAPASAAWIEAFWGVVAAGCVVMPIDPQIGDEDLRRMIRIGECRLMLTDNRQIERLRKLAPSCAAIDLNAVAKTPRAATSPDSVDSASRTAAAHDVAVLAFTSGTTGSPKAVPLTHANLLSNVEAILTEAIVGPRDNALVPLPLYHTYPLTVGMLSVLAAGATIVFPAGISGPQLVAAIHQGQVTALLGVPRLYDAILTSIRAEVTGRDGLLARLFPVLVSASSTVYRLFGLPVGRWLFRPLRSKLGSTLRLMVSGGAALPLEVELAFEGLGWQVLTGYGLTETSPIVTFNRPGRSRSGSVGQALPGVSVRIVNADAEGTGDIEVRGISVFAGYRGDAAATNAAFTPDGWFRTGDLGRLDADGYLFIAARATETIALPSGKKVYPEPIEAAYAENPNIREIGVMSGATGLVALVVPNEEAVRTAGTFRLEGLIGDALRMRARTLPSYLRLTGFAITRKPLPRTQLGKLRRHFLRALYEEARKPHAAEGGGSAAAAEETQFDNPLATAVWTWMRARYPGQAVDLDSSPQLDLGIDSLGWVDLTLALQREFGIALTEQQIARIVTIKDLLREVTVAKAPDEVASAIAEQAKTWLAPYGVGVGVVRFVGEMLLRAAMHSFFRLHIEGGETLPQPPFLLCPNHVSYLDPFALAAALTRRQLGSTYWAGWTGLLFTSPLRRLFSRAAHVIPLDPDRAAAAGIALGSAVLARGHALVWFAEGALSPDGSLQRFQPGVGALVDQHPVPVIPVLIAGTEVAFPPGKRLPRPGRITVRFGQPIELPAAAAGISGRQRDQQIADTIHARVAALGAKTAAGKPQ